MRVSPHKYGESILLAVSGGVDSMLMGALCAEAWKAAFGSLDKIAVAHCNFGLRAEESDLDEALVRRWAQEAGMSCFVKRFDTAAYAAERGISIEMAARDLRYAWFDSLCREMGFAGVCVAHNANDNAETLLLNLVRGCGLKGACGMKEVSENPCGDSLVFRPLLPYTRAVIEECARARGVQWRTDSTNLASEVKRNLLRNQVIPLLRKMNPSVVETLCRDIENFSRAQTVLEEALCYDLWEEDRMEIARLLSAPHWEYYLYSCLSEKGFHPSVIQSLAQLLKEGAVVGGRTFHGPDCDILTSSTQLLLLPHEGAASSRRPGYVISLEDWDPSSDPRTQRGTIIMDAACFPDGGPVVRELRSGDYLCPIGLGGCRKKVSDLLTDLHYDRNSKKNALVVEGEGSHVLAVLGERVDRSVAVTPRTRKIYRIAIS